MLETVKRYIASLPDTTFGEYYTKYIADVQDANIDRELKYLLNRNLIDPLSMSVLVQNTYERLGEILDCRK